MTLAVMTMFWGALVAGLRAGWVYNSFPMMGKHLWPGEIFSMTPAWKNFFENHATVQFTHRVLAVLTFAIALFTAWRGKSKLFIALGAAAFIQTILGISALLTNANIVLAALHQAGAMSLLAILTALLYKLSLEKKS
jgi:cytochrome c oxidase assembly protein subunit 15